MICEAQKKKREFKKRFLFFFFKKKKNLTWRANHATVDEKNLEVRICNLF